MFVLVSRCVETKPLGSFLTNWIVLPLLSVIHRKTKELVKLDEVYFHFLIPEDTEEESSTEEWHGKLVALKRTIKSEAGNTNRTLGGQFIHYLRLKDRHSMVFCSEIRRNTKDELAAVFDRMRNMEESVGEMKTAVDQILQKLTRLEPSST